MGTLDSECETGGGKTVVSSGAAFLDVYQPLFVPVYRKSVQLIKPFERYN